MSETDGAAGLEKVVAACQLGSAFAAILREAGIETRVHGPDRPPWLPDPDVNVIVTQPRCWADAPQEQPPEWPGAVRFIQLGSAGIDGYPRWMFNGPVVATSRGVAAPPISEYVLAAMLTVAKEFDRLAVRGPAGWKARRLGGLYGARLGLVGYGAIGEAVATRARAFGMKVSALRRRGAVAAEGVEPAASVAELAATCDHLVLALPLTPESRGIISREVLMQAKPGLHLVNISRGGLIDQQALLEALDNGPLGFATLDVAEPEPPPEGHPFYSHPKIRLTPHISWSDSDTQVRLGEKTIANIRAFAAGRAPRDVVGPDSAY
ncbi:NAD(P)-dependent oxidoreductase [Camelimonas abortus]|uniref:NAD(P)-dependent oxidoreductase n=1 Tax=Camelimonas abortus TaxID=1017184 RepID=A0ABV7LG71_9HYPH